MQDKRYEMSPDEQHRGNRRQKNEFNCSALHRHPDRLANMESRHYPPQYPCEISFLMHHWLPGELAVLQGPVFESRQQCRPSARSRIGEMVHLLADQKDIDGT